LTAAHPTASSVSLTRVSHVALADVHPTYGYLTEWAAPSQVETYRGLHAPTPTTRYPSSRTNDVAAASLGKARAVAPATLVKLATASRMQQRPSTAGARRPGGPAAAAAAAGTSASTATLATLGGLGGGAPAARARARPATAPAGRRPQLPVDVRKLRETSTVLLPPRTLRSRQIAQAMYPQLYRSRRRAGGGEMSPDEAATAIQSMHRGNSSRKGKKGSSAAADFYRRC
jgi:hypothetical protein